MLQQLDVFLFECINTGLSNSVFDLILPIIREKLVWIPLYVFILAFILFNYKKQSYWMIVFLFITAGTSDIISSHVIKKSVQRLRPCNSTELFEDFNRRVRCGSGYSFTSSHAANHYAIAWYLVFVLAGIPRWAKYSLLTWAGAICLAQVYVGVHFPVDVFCGALLGFLVAYGGSWIYGRVV